MLHGNIEPSPLRPARPRPMLRVLLVNDTDKPIADLAQALRAAGYEVLPHVAVAARLLKAVQEQQPVQGLELVMQPVHGLHSLSASVLQ